METRTAYINRNKIKIEAERIYFSDCMAVTLEDEYYDEIIPDYIEINKARIVKFYTA